MSSSYYSQERLENISHIMPTYAAFVRPGDRVKLGLEGDTLFPEAYRGNRPMGTVESVVGPDNNQVVNIKLDEKFGGRMAHCDVLSLNPYLSFELEDVSFQNALQRSKDEPEIADKLRSQHHETDIVFRGMFGRTQEETPAPPSANASSVETRLARLESDLSSLRSHTDESIEKTRETTFRAVRGVCEDIKNSMGEQTYAGRMLTLLGDEDEDVQFRGVDDSDSDSSVDL